MVTEWTPNTAPGGGRGTSVVCGTAILVHLEGISTWVPPGALPASLSSSRSQLLMAVLLYIAMVTGPSYQVKGTVG